MKTKPAYLVIDTYRNKPTIVRVTQSWPQLNPGEIATRIELTLDDDLIPLHRVEVEDPDALIEAVVVPAEPEDELV